MGGHRLLRPRSSRPDRWRRQASRPVTEANPY